MKKIFIRTFRHGAKIDNGSTNNYQVTGFSAQREGNTILLTEICINDYGRTFEARGYSYALTFAPSELEGIPQGYLGEFKDQYLEED